MNTKRRYQQARSAVTVNDILEATLLLIQAGKKLNMQSIADRAGVSVGTVYHHFDSKPSLLTATVSAYLDRLYGQLFQACTKPAYIREKSLEKIFQELIILLQTSACARSFILNPTTDAELAWAEFAEKTANLIANTTASFKNSRDHARLTQLARARIEGIRAMIISSSSWTEPASLNGLRSSLLEQLLTLCEFNQSAALHQRVLAANG
jgi:AcrR family transcriptional regulator